MSTTELLSCAFLLLLGTSISIVIPLTMYAFVKIFNS